MMMDKIQDKTPLMIGPTELQSLTTLEEYRDDRGVTVRMVHVPDISEHSPTRESMQASIAEWNQLLQDNPQWAAPTIDPVDGAFRINNEVSRAVYHSPGMHAWRSQLVPTAEALIPMQNTDITELPLHTIYGRSGDISQVVGGQLVDDVARSFFVDALDSIGIRTRATIMASIAERTVDPAEETTWVSLACGAALPVLQALDTISRDGIKAHLHLIDYNQGTLETARRLAQSRGLEEGIDFSIDNRNLLKDLIVTDSLLETYEPESATMVDALGIFEYFDDARSAIFIQNAYRIVKPGGALVIANMLSSRPELDFNQRGIGWPKIYPRSLEEVTDVISSAGIPLSSVEITIPEDGVYAVVEIKK